MPYSGFLSPKSTTRYLPILALSLKIPISVLCDFRLRIDFLQLFPGLFFPALNSLTV